MWDFLSGWKTKIAAVGLMLYAVGGFIAGALDPGLGIGLEFDAAYAMLLNGLGLLGLRVAIDKK